MRESVYHGKASRLERRSDFATTDHDEALARAKEYRQDGMNAQVKVVKSRYGKPKAWGVFIKHEPPPEAIAEAHLNQVGRIT